jgi:hypothetical protein
VGTMQVIGLLFEEKNERKKMRKVRKKKVLMELFMGLF